MSGFPIMSQTPGLIYKPSYTSFGSSVLDPNGDTFKLSANAGFSAADYGNHRKLTMNTITVFYKEIQSTIIISVPGTNIQTWGSNSKQYR